MTLNDTVYVEVDPAIAGDIETDTAPTEDAPALEMLSVSKPASAKRQLRIVPPVRRVARRWPPDLRANGESVDGPRCPRTPATLLRVPTLPTY